MDLAVGPGEVVGLLGANGAGKTTLIRMLLGLLPVSGGSVRLFGQPPSRASRRRVGYLPQGLGLYDDLTIAENLAFSRAVFGGAGTPALSAPDVPVALRRYAAIAVRDLPLGVARRAAFAQVRSTPPNFSCSTSRHPASTRWPGRGCGRRSRRRPPTARGSS